jgi:alanyl-tRNA synthetase
VDTGMGLERLARVIQEKQSNYDTDVFTGIIVETEKKVNKVYKGGDDKESVAFRVIADHIRAISFTIADGQLPSNTGAGYVIRRVLRRAVRYYFSYLDYKQPLLTQLVPVIAKQFENIFPELHKQVDFVGKVVKEEEEAFLRTLDKGLKRVDDLVAKGEISGKDSFELYDTYGFPFDLTQLIVSENKLRIDEEGFKKEMKQQKSRSRAATSIDAGDWIELKQGSNKFVGYDSLEAKTSVLKYRKVKTKGKEVYQIVLDRTPFYAESGGQVGDQGQLIINNEELIITDTKRDNDLIIHFAESIPANLSGEVIAKVDAGKRKNIALHHSATHLVHAALRKVLGAHVAQKGSLVNDEHLRFDFSHFAKTTGEEISKVEALVNENIRENIPVVIKEMPKDEAMKMGAMALFGEKYGDFVRVVIIDPNYSVELCGGTHVGATGELGLFKITTETAVAAGVRRIEAICGKQTEEYLNEQLYLISSLRETFKNPKDIQKAIENLQTENAELKKHLESMEARQLVTVRNELLQKDEIINGINFVGDIVEVSNPDALKKLCFDLKNHLRDHVAVLCVNIGGKPFVAVGISDTIVAAKGLDANKIIKEQIAPLIKGGGGGQKTLATAGGQEPGGLKEAIEVVRKML